MLKKKKRKKGGSPTCQCSFAEQSVQNDVIEDSVKRLVISGVKTLDTALTMSTLLKV